MPEPHDAKKRMMEYLKRLGRPKPRELKIEEKAKLEAFIRDLASGTLKQDECDYWRKKLFGRSFFGRSLFKRFIRMINPDLKIEN